MKSQSDMSDKTIELYTSKGEKTMYSLLITASKKYYLTKLVESPDSRYTDKTKYMTMVIRCVEDPFDIVQNNTRLFMNSKDLDCI